MDNVGIDLLLISVAAANLLLVDVVDVVIHVVVHVVVHVLLVDRVCIDILVDNTVRV